MADRETCPACGSWTSLGRQRRAEHHRQHPIYGTDFTKPLSVLIEEQRRVLVEVRGRLGDISAAFPGWDERVASVEGLLTCGLIVLYELKAAMLVMEQQRTACAALGEGA